MTLAAIKETLIDAYVDGDFDIETAWENRKFNPVNGTPWARVTIIPNQPEIVTLGATGEDEHTGVMQIDLFYPQDKGDGDILAMADSIREVFKGGARLVNEGQMVIINSCGRGAGRNENGWFRMIITINWWARTQRS
jgi:hypothetical protein